VESLEDSPSAALGREGPLVAFTDWAKDDSSATTPSRLYDTDAAIPGGTRHQVDQHGAAHVETFSPSLLALPDGDALVAWQDMARGPGDIYVRRVGSDGAPAGRAQRVDDTGTAGWNQWRPALALTARRVVAAWEDERDGPAQIYAARARAARLR
jgi:hypothetical protein